MKKIFLFLVIIALSFGAKAQTWTPIFGKQRFASGLGIPTKDSTYFAGAADSSLIYINPKDAGLYYKYKGYHKKVNTGTNYVPYIGATANVNLGSYNLTANNIFDGYSSIAASGTQVVLTVNSVPSYLVTGSGGQTIKLPDATTIPKGAVYVFNNNQSSGAILVNNNSNTLVKSVPSGAYLTLELIDNANAAGSWDSHFQSPSNVSWSTNTFDYAGSITSATWNGSTVQPNRGGTGQSTYTDGQLLIGNSTGNTLSKATLTAGAGISVTNGAGSISVASTITQYTDANARAALSFTAGSGAYNSTTGVITIPTNTNQLLNGASFITLGSLSASSPLSYNNTTGMFSIPVATTSASGYLSSTDWTTFNSKQAQINGTGFVKASGTTISYDNSTYLTTSAATSTYLPLVGGTLTGTLNGTVLNFSQSSLSTTISGYNGKVGGTGIEAGAANGRALYLVNNSTTYPLVELVALSATKFIKATNNSSAEVFSINTAGDIVIGGTLGNGTYTYTLPSASGTLALTSDLHNAVTIGTANGLSLSTQVLSLGLASSIANGALSSTDFNTFNSKVAGSGTSGQVAYFNGTNSITSNASFAFTPTSQLLVNNSVTAASAIARGTNLTPNLTAVANNDALVGLDVNPVYTNGGFTGIANFGLRIIPRYTAQIALGGTSNAGTITFARGGDGTYQANVGYSSSGTNSDFIISSRGGSSVIGIDLNTRIAQFVANGLILQNGGTFTDAGYRLDVNGTARVQGELTVNTVNIGLGGGAIATNTRVGTGALNANTTGNNNTAIGYLALINNTTGGSNTAIGKESIYTNTTGGNNVGVGYQALNKNTTGGDNTAVGNFALSNNTTASSNIAVGGYALFNNTTGTYNTSLGFQVNVNNTTGSNITAVGFQANTSNTTGNDNTAVGYQALAGNTTGYYNTVLGKFAGQYITTGNSNTIIGAYAGTAAMSSNVILSDGAGNIRFQYNGTNTILGQSGSVILNGALSGTSATFSSSVTAQAIYASDATGSAILTTNGGGEGILSVNTANPLRVLINGGEKVRVTPAGNLGIGTTAPTDYSGYTTLHINGKSGNLGGVLRLTSYDASSGGNIYAASSAFNFNTTTPVPFIWFTQDTERMRITNGGELYWNLTGTTAGSLNPGGILFRNNSGKYIQISTGLTTDASLLIFYKSDGAGGVTNTGSISTSGNLTLYNTTSDYRLKQDFKPYGGLDIINKIKTYDYQWKSDKTRSYGVIAHELQEVLPYAVSGVKDGEQMQQVDYSKIVPILVQAIKDLNQKIVNLEAQIKQ